MKTSFFDFSSRARKVAAAVLAVFGAALLVPCAHAQDPMQLGSPLAQALQSQLRDGSGLELLALVAAGDDNGVALAKAPGMERPAVLRRDATVAVEQNGIPLRLNVASVTDRGVALTNGSIQAPILLPPSVLPPADADAERPAETSEAGAPRLRLVEFNGVELDLALRLLADQTGLNFSVSPDAAQTKVTLCLRNVTAEDVLAQICSAHRLWSPPRTADGAPLRVQTLAEFEQSLSSAQPTEQQSKIYRLLYPNVTEVASVIYGLYRDRVRLFLGDEDLLDDDLNDLSRRFERLNMLSNGSSELVEGFTGGNAGNRAGTGTIFSQDRDGRWNALDETEAAAVRGNGPVRRLDAAEARLIAAAAADAQGANADAAASVLAEARAVPPAIFVTVARRSNMLILRCVDPRIMADLDEIIRQLDVPSPMVMLDLKVLEVSLGDDLDAIFDYKGSGKFHYDGHHEGGMVGTFPASSLLEKGLTFDVVTENITSRFQLLQEKGRAKILATPSLLTVNNEASQLFMGKEVPIVRNVTATTYMSGENVVSVPQTQFEFQRVGTSLLITPNVNSNGTVTLRLLQENSALSATKGSIPIYTDQGKLQYFDVDIVESRSVAGTFVAQDRQTIAIGGMVREEVSDQRSGVPLLMDIPLLGWLFRSTKQVTSRSELVIFVTPYVVQTPVEGLGATEAYAERNLQFDDTRRAASAAPLTKEQKKQRQKRRNAAP